MQAETIKIVDFHFSDGLFIANGFTEVQGLGRQRRAGVGLIVFHIAFIGFVGVAARCRSRKYRNRQNFTFHRCRNNLFRFATQS